jgi:hypothetical protein
MVCRDTLQAWSIARFCLKPLVPEDEYRGFHLRGQRIAQGAA